MERITVWSWCAATTFAHKRTHAHKHAHVDLFWQSKGESLGRPLSSFTESGALNNTMASGKAAHDLNSTRGEENRRWLRLLCDLVWFSYMLVSMCFCFKNLIICLLHKKPQTPCIETPAGLQVLFGLIKCAMCVPGGTNKWCSDYFRLRLRLNNDVSMTWRLTFSSLSWSPLQSVFKETLKAFQTGLRLFMTVYNIQRTKHQFLLVAALKQ